MSQEMLLTGNHAAKKPRAAPPLDPGKLSLSYVIVGNSKKIH